MIVDPTKFRLARNFTLQEMLRTNVVASNVPNEEQLSNLNMIANTILQPARTHLGPLWVTSGFRCFEVNKAVGGSEHSRHMKGEAADIWKSDLIGLFMYLLDQSNFHKLVWEFGRWIHVSRSFGTNKGEVLVATPQGFEPYTGREQLNV